jgi:hypothetical protein
MEYRTKNIPKSQIRSIREKFQFFKITNKKIDFFSYVTITDING